MRSPRFSFSLPCQMGNHARQYPRLIAPLTQLGIMIMSVYFQLRLFKGLPPVIA